MIAQQQEITRRAMLATGAIDRAGIDAILTMDELPVRGAPPAGAAANPNGTGPSGGGNAGPAAPVPAFYGNETY
jgi:hypothetical protein